MKTKVFVKSISVALVASLIGYAIAQKPSAPTVAMTQIQVLEIQLIHSAEATDPESVERIATALYAMYQQEEIAVSSTVRQALTRACTDERDAQEKSDHYSMSRQRHIFQCNALKL